MQRIIVTMMFIVLAYCRTSLAQQTTGNITGRVVDQQGAAVPGVTVTAKSPRPVSREPRRATPKASTG